MFSRFTHKIVLVALSLMGLAAGCDLQNALGPGCTIDADYRISCSDSPSDLTLSGEGD
jgi:hypothetical protein